MRTHYVRDENRTPIATLVEEYLGDNQWKLALARCNPKDQFSKAMGKHIAAARLNKKPAIALNSLDFQVEHLCQGGVVFLREDPRDLVYRVKTLVPEWRRNKVVI